VTSAESYFAEVSIEGGEILNRRRRDDLSASLFYVEASLDSGVYASLKLELAAGELETNSVTSYSMPSFSDIIVSSRVFDLVNVDFLDEVTPSELQSLYSLTAAAATTAATTSFTSIRVDSY